MSSVNPYPIDLGEFHTFLAAQEVSAIAGMACDDGDCPLARFLASQYPGSTFLVNMFEYRRVMDDISLGVERDEVFPLDPWAQDFVSLTDESASFLDDYPVSVADALCFLEVVGYAHGLVEVVHG